MRECVDPELELRAMSEPTVCYEVTEGIAYITLNRPHKLNAFNLEMSAALRDTWARFESDRAAKVAILSGKGDSFSSGVDLTDEDRGEAKPWQYHEAYPRNGISVFKPIIGAVRGYALGQGHVIAVTGCDITIAGESALFGFPESKAGVALPPPTYTPYMPFKVSLEFMLLAWKGGRFLDAQRAYDLGVINAVVPDDRVMEEAVLWAQQLQEIPPLYIKAVKRGYYAGTERKLTIDEREYIEYTLPQETSEDRQEAIRAFREKRTPRFTGD